MVAEMVWGVTVEVLLAGIGGALAVFLLGLLREWWRNERERRGYLRLLLAEIKHNGIVIDVIQKSDTPLRTSPHLDALKTETWAESREVVAGLPSELKESLVFYYETLEIFQTLKSLPDPDPNRETIESSLAKFMEPLWEPYTRLFHKRPKDRRGRYERITLDAQDKAKSSIVGYLELSWWEHLLLASVRLIDRQNRPS